MLHVKFRDTVSVGKRFEKIVEIIVELIEDGMRDQFVRQKALEIIGGRNVQGHDEIGEIQAITTWVKTHLRYVKEPPGVEIFHSGRRLIKDIEAGKGNGDCDDFVILWGALLGSIGYPVGALIVDSSGDGTFNHVMGVTKTFGPTKKFGRDWIPVELIYPDFELGTSVPVSKVYPLMADARHIQAPLSKHTINGLRGIASSYSKRSVRNNPHCHCGGTMGGGSRNNPHCHCASKDTLMGLGSIGSLNKAGSHIPRGNSARKLLANPKYSGMGEINWSTNETWGVLISGATVGVMTVLLFNRFVK